MKSKFALAMAGGTLFLTMPDADAALIQWASPATAQNELSWSSDGAFSLEAYLPPGGQEIVNDDDLPPNAMGPGGGVLLVQAGRKSIEINRDEKTVEAIYTDPAGTVLQRRTLVKLQDAAPEAFAPGSQAHVLVTARKVVGARSASLLKGQQGARYIIAIDVALYDVGSGQPSVVQEVSLAYDWRTMKPVVSPAALQAWDNYWISTQSYWSN